nr:PilX N-terminal domain-containing pilus assembly protein [uncultured Moraxella sp.]
MKQDTINQQNISLSSYHHQQGATLIVVLLMLILIMLIGVMAMRRSTTDLQLATSDQVNTLLLQGADGANVKLEQMLNGDPTARNYIDATADNGIFGHFFKAEAAQDELVFCYNPRQTQSMTNVATIYRGTGTLMTGGNCDPENTNSYISARNTVLTQVGLKLSDTATTATESFTTVAEGRDVNLGDGIAAPSKYLFDMRSLSVIPSYGDTGTCFNNRMTGSGTTVNSCLGNRNIPKKQLYSQAAVEYTSGKINCVSYGVGTGNYASNKCALLTATTSN